MPTYTVHEPPPREGESEPIPSASCSCATDSISGPSCWRRCGCCVHRLWLVLLVYVVVDHAARRRAPCWSARRRRCNFSPACWSRCSSASRRRRSGAGRLRAAAGGRSASWSATMRKCAERRFFAAWIEARRRDAPTPPPPAEPHYAAPVRRGPPSASDVIGLFPEPGGAAMSVAIVDYGSGNLHSAAKAFERAARESGHDQPIMVTSDPAQVRRGRPRGAAGRRRLRRLPARARRHSRHGRGAERKRAATRAGRFSASASACN